jgi:hypothetical protein
LLVAALAALVLTGLQTALEVVLEDLELLQDFQ